MGVTGPLGFKLKSHYGIAQMGESLVNGVLGSFLLFYYSQVLGLPPSMAAMGVGTAVIIDAVTDPLVGSVSDHWRSRLGRRHPFLLFGSIPTGFCLFLLFNPMVSGHIGLLLWMIAFVNLTRTFMTIFHIPHIALGAELSDDYDERSSIVGYRTFFANIGGLSAFVLGFGFFFAPTVEFPNGQLNAAAYPGFAALAGCLVVITVLWTALSTRHVIPLLPKAAPSARINLVAVIIRVFRDSYAALRCQNFFWLFLGVLLLFVIIGVDSALGLYMYTFFWELTPKDIIILSPAFPIGAMVGIVLSPYMLRITSKKAMLQFGLLAWAFWQTLPVVLRLTGAFPENGSDLLVPLLFSMRVIQGICTVQSNIAFGSMTADSVDEHELNTHQRQEGIFFAASSFATKAPVGIGNIIAGFALAFIDWPVGTTVKTAADIGPDRIFALGVIVGPGVAASALVCMWCYSRYTLTRQDHEQILLSLRARRAIAGSG